MFSFIEAGITTNDLISNDQIVKERVILPKETPSKVTTPPETDIAHSEKRRRRSKICDMIDKPVSNTVYLPKTTKTSKGRIHDLTKIKFQMS